MTTIHEEIILTEKYIERLKNSVEIHEKLIDKQASFVTNTKRYKDKYGNKPIYSGHINDQNYETLIKLGRGKVDEIMGDLIYEFPNFTIELRTDTDEEHIKKLSRSTIEATSMLGEMLTGSLISGFLSRTIEKALKPPEETNESVSDKIMKHAVESIPVIMGLHFQKEYRRINDKSKDETKE